MRFRIGAVAAALAVLVAPTLDARPEPGTFSIVARDPVTGEIGVAVQSRAFNVGQGVPWAMGGVGAIATQAWTNSSFGPRGLELLAEGLAAPDVLDALIQSDDGRQHRQLAVLDANGRTASWTGESCMDWAGGVRRENLAAQGNILASEAVVDGMVTAFDETEGSLAEKLLAALEGAQAAGGDKRGQQSAALIVVCESERHPEYRERFVDLRVDDHEAPIAELRRLYRIFLSTDVAEAYLELADEHAEAGDVARADGERARVGEILRRVTADPDATASELNALAWVAATHDMYLADAIAAAERAVEMEETPEILDTLAESQWRAGAYEEAVATGRRALAHSPGDPYLEEQLAKYEASRDAGERVEPVAP